MKYKKFTQLEHILTRPDTYVGSLNQVTDYLWILNKEKTKIIKHITTHVPGLYKIYDEILVNAIDQSVNDNTLDQIRIEIDKNEGSISVMNTGEGVPIEKHEEHDVFIPEMIFGELLTSSNYDDTQERITGGRNGYGAKLANIFSKRFMVEIGNSKQELEYSQTWENNMTKKNEYKLKKYKKSKGYVKITFWPDFERFGLNSLFDDNICDLFEKRAYDCCACTNENVKVFLNGKQIHIKSFEKYIDLYIGDKKTTTRVYDNTNDRWKICVAPSDGYNQISFVNGINTYIGGSHVDSVMNQITKQLCEYIENKHKNLKIKTQYIKEHLFIFVNATLVNPSFSSQTKSECTSRYKDFGSRFTISEEFIAKISKIGILDEIIALAKHKEMREMSKNDGKKKSTIRIPKLDDAIYAGTSKSKQCTLILTEGDSAKTFAISGLSIVGRDKYGVFPLKGKLLNVRDASSKQLIANEEINNLKQILGLQQDKKYKDISELRYGKIMILTDSDVDGSHIKGLLMNFINTFWPELMDLNFICSMKTPILKARNKRSNEVICFYTKLEYDKWKQNENSKNWNIKYYKGLGTSTSNEAKEYFKSLPTLLTNYEYTSNCTDAIDLAFNKKKSDNRKIWIKDKLNHIVELPTINSYDDFVHKELIDFSIADVVRSIPNIMDGLKPSQRKILFSCRKHAKDKEYKVSQLSGIISSETQFHHGETSLMSTIVGMAQTFIGSNNINLLIPNGQFGTRLMGGADSASPRYIFTQLSPIVKNIIHEYDDPLLNFLEDDGIQIEPEFFLPTIPLVLINSINGIGTGFSTKIPSFNPSDIIKNIQHLMDGKPLIPMIPWYKHFKGTIKQIDTHRFTTHGVWNVISSNEIHVTELPINFWTNDFKEHLDSLLDTKIKKYENHSTENNVSFTIHFKDNEQDVEKLLKLSTNLSTSNMHLFNVDGKIKKYDNPEEILCEFYNYRLIQYEKRRKHIITILEDLKHELNIKIMFMQYVMDEQIKIFKIPKKQIIEQMISFKISSGYHDQLLNIPLFHFTHEKLDELFKKLENTETKYLQMQKENMHSLWRYDLDNIKNQFK